MFQVELNVTKKAWLSNPPERWNSGLDRAGINFRQHLQSSYYPPIPPNSTYVRTGRLAHSANYKLTELGKVMEFGAVSYLKFLLMPARTVMHWAGKKEELLTAMQQGFADGIRHYSGE